MILGFDVSTTTAGWCFSYDNKIKDAGFINIKKLETSKDKTFEVINFIENHSLFKETKKINIEAALSGFAGGFTTQQVIIKLSRFNAVFEYILSEHWDFPIQLLNVNTARKKVLGKCRESGVKSKDFVKIYLEKLHDIHKFDVLNKNKNWDQRNSDMYDAMVISLYN